MLKKYNRAAAVLVANVKPISEATTQKPSYYVVWRSGGTKMFKWQRTIAMTLQTAREAVKHVHVGGHFGYIQPITDFDKSGFPTRYGGL